jgi:hypothetical protein
MNDHDSVVTIRADRQYAKPTVTMSVPRRLSGHRSQANSPVPMKAAPISGPKIVIRSRWCPPTLSMATTRRMAHTTTPATAIPASARRRLGDRADRATDRATPGDG